MPHNAIAQSFETKPLPVFKRAELDRFIAQHAAEWNLPRELRGEEIVELLLKTTKLQKHHFALPHRAETIYAWGNVSPYCIASHVKANGYLSHYTAMHLHELTNQVPEVVYVNHEQRPQPKPAGGLSQEAVNRVFKGKQRTTKNVARFGKQRLCVVNGKHTGQLGVIEGVDSNGHPIKLTGLERTLIDITVRPVYSGGVGEVLEAFRRASDRIQVNRLVGMLAKMDFVYPYHQAIGFYMERAGYPNKRLELLRHGNEIEIDFYLTYGMRDPAYSDRWRLYYPSGM